ncbi:Conserved_hypothetical protein [Hexamita inflata]|uniref:Transmembrane protein n=1 Tax=Hexamita inflata TaxID=28002 RepID=A0AA86U1G6_9EUKA|nr:Conserved hypothetical protein [Hexamita inflata]
MNIEVFQLQSLDSCFSRKTCVEYDQNLNILILVLFGTRNSICESLTGDIQVNLTLTSKAFTTSLFVIVSDYLYQDLFQIQFEANMNADILTDEHFLVATLFNLRYQTIVQPAVIDQINSELQYCFASLTVSVSANSTFEMCPNTYCKNIMVQKQENPIQYVQQIQLVIGQYVYLLNTQQFLARYSIQECFKEDLHLSNLRQHEIFQQPFTTSNLNIFFKGRKLVNIKYQVTILTITETSVFKNQIAYLYNYDNDIGYQIMFDYDLEQLNLVMQQIDMIQYDRLEYKLTGAILTEFGMQQLSIVQNAPQFNQSVKSIVFSCSNMQGAQQHTCFQLLANDYGAAYSVPTYNLYFSFYQNDQLQQVLKAENCQSRYTCWNNGVAIIKATGLEIELTTNGYCVQAELYNYDSIQTRMYVQKNSKTIQQVDKVFHVKTLANISKFRYTCAEINCTQISEQSRYIFEYDMYLFTQRFEITEVKDKRNYQKYIKLVIGCTGSIMIVFLFCVVFILLRRSMQVINAYKGKQIVRQPSETEILIQQLKQKNMKRKIE